MGWMSVHGLVCTLHLLYASFAVRMWNSACSARYTSTRIQELGALRSLIWRAGGLPTFPPMQICTKVRASASSEGHSLSFMNCCGLTMSQIHPYGAVTEPTFASCCTSAYDSPSDSACILMCFNANTAPEVLSTTCCTKHFQACISRLDQQPLHA